MRLAGVILSSFKRPDRTSSEQLELGGCAVAHDHLLRDDPSKDEQRVARL
jgi:hypothetical protein